MWYRNIFVHFELVSQSVRKNDKRATFVSCLRFPIQADSFASFAVNFDYRPWFQKLRVESILVFSFTYLIFEFINERTHDSHSSSKLYCKVSNKLYYSSSQNFNQDLCGRVSSVLGRDVKSYGKQYLFDGSDETCWNSDQVFGCFKHSSFLGEFYWNHKK